MANQTISSFRRALFTPHKFRDEARRAAVVSLLCLNASAMIVIALMDRGFEGWAFNAIPFGLCGVLVFVLNITAMFALAARSCDPVEYGSSNPWLFGLFANRAVKPTLREALTWFTPRGRSRLAQIANS